MAYIRKVQRYVDGRQYMLIKDGKSYILQQGDIAYILTEKGKTESVTLSLSPVNRTKTFENRNTSQSGTWYAGYGEDIPINFTVEYNGSYTIDMRANWGYYNTSSYAYNGERKRFTKTYAAGQVITGNFGVCGYYSNIKDDDEYYEAHRLVFDGVTARGGGDCRDERVRKGQETWGHLTISISGYVDNEGTFYSALPSDAMEV